MLPDSDGIGQRCSAMRDTKVPELARENGVREARIYS
jgi:hypothetical protein